MTELTEEQKKRTSFPELPKLYERRDIMGLDRAGNYYMRHVDRLTVEDLHAKSAIAAELGYRDMVIHELRVEVATLRLKLKEHDL